MAGVETPPFALQNASHSAELFRIASAAWLGTPLPGTMTSPLRGPANGSSFQQGSQQVANNVGGVVGLNDFTITQNGTPNMSVNVAGGQIYIPGGSIANQGPYFGLSDAATNLTIAAASASNPRIDTVIAFVEDASISGANNDWKLQIVTGTATAGATLSNLTGAGSLASFPNCVVLGYVLVPISASSIVTADILNSQPLLSPGFSGLLQRGTPQIRATSAGGTAVNGQTTVPFTSQLAHGGMTVVSNGIIIPAPGTYDFFGSVNLSVLNNPQVLTVNLFKNGSVWSTGQEITVRGATGGDLWNLVFADSIPCVVGDSITVVVGNGGPTSVAIGSGAGTTYVNARLGSG